MSRARTFFTIGYEGSSIDNFITTLQQAGVKVLIDVRDVPLSRKRGFSKTSLAAHLEANGISYVHLRGLGDPKPGREAARAGQYSLFRRIFGHHMETETAQRDLEKAVELVKKHPSTLMCFEKEHCQCHRSIVASHIIDLTGMSAHNLVVNEAPVCEELPYQPALAA
jgi:uncharacterized protein (DUF488 family)